MRKLALRRRLEDYKNFILQYGHINRKDMMKIGEISMPQASADLKALMEDYPEFQLEYNKTSKKYEAKREAFLFKENPKCDPAP